MMLVPATFTAEVEIPDPVPGPQGEQGIQGEQGNNGLNGLNGADGLPGPVGAAGPPGAIGPAGADGAAGPSGPVGPAGSSAGARTVITNMPVYPADGKAILQAGLDTADVNRGGLVLITESRSKLLTGVASTRQGLVIKGEGMPGVDKVTCLGSTQLAIADGITGITLGTAGTHQTRGYGLERLHIFADGPLGDGTGVKILNAEENILRDLSISDFVAGKGLVIDGTNGNCQYIIADNLRIARCQIGLHQLGPTSIHFNAGYFNGYPQDLSAATRTGTGYLLDGGSCLISNTVFQCWQTAINLRKNNSRIVARFENNGVGVRIGGLVNGCLIEGQFTSTTTPIYIEAGARNIRIRRWLVAPDCGPCIIEEPHPSIVFEDQYPI